MRFLFFGAGAIGTYIGGSLKSAGYEIAFVERPEVAGRIRREGILLSLAGSSRRIPVPAAFPSGEEALRSAPFDVCVFALKSYDTAAALQTVESLKHKFPPVLCLQNGVDNEPALARVLGPERVIAGTVTSAVGRSADGAAVLERMRGVGIAAGHSLSEPLVEAFTRAGLNARLYPNAPSMKWSKMLTNLISNASSAILGLTPGEIYNDPRLFLLEREMLRECLRVMRAAGIPVTDLPGTPVRALAFAVEHLPGILARPFLARAVGGGRGGKMPSLYIDLHGGRGKTEVQWLNGAVARAGQKTGVAAPVNTLLAETLARLAEGVEKPENYLKNPLKLISMLPLAAASRIGLARPGPLPRA
jgi:2-dehydropantoate 2-reductase